MFANPLRYLIQCRYSKIRSNILQLITLMKVASGGAILTGPGGASQAAGATRANFWAMRCARTGNSRPFIFSLEIAECKDRSDGSFY